MVRPTPVRRSPFPAAPFGYLQTTVATGFDACSTPLCELPFSSELYNYPSAAPARACRCTSPGVPSPTALYKTRRPDSPTVHPPAPSVFRVSHPLDVLLRLIPYRAYCIPAALLGFTRTSPARPDLSIQTGPTRPRSLSTAFSSPMTDTFWRALPSCASRPSCAEPFHGLDVDRCGRCTVSITEEAVYPLVASQGHQPS